MRAQRLHYYSLHTTYKNLFMHAAWPQQLSQLISCMRGVILEMASLLWFIQTRLECRNVGS